MAKNNQIVAKEAAPDKRNRLAETFTKEYKYEGVILLVLSLIAIILGTLIYKGVNSSGDVGLTINENVFLIGDYPKTFAWILIGLGSVSLILSIWPYYKPSIYEVKRVTWPTQKLMLLNCADVFIYTIALTLFFYLCDLLMNWISSLIA